MFAQPITSASEGGAGGERDRRRSPMRRGARAGHVRSLRERQGVRSATQPPCRGAAPREHKELMFQCLHPGPEAKLRASGSECVPERANVRRPSLSRKERTDNAHYPTLLRSRAHVVCLGIPARSRAAWRRGVLGRSDIPTMSDPSSSGVCWRGGHSSGAATRRSELIRALGTRLPPLGKQT